MIDSYVLNPIPIVVSLIDENTGQLVSGADVFYDVRNLLDEPLSPQLNGALIESQLVGGTYKSIISIDTAGKYLCYIVSEGFPTNVIEINIENKSVYSAIDDAESNIIGEDNDNLKTLSDQIDDSLDLDNVWDVDLSQHAVSGSSGEILNTIYNDQKKVLGLLHHNIYIDQSSYDAYGNLSSARIRIYSDSNSVGTNNNIITSYILTSVNTDTGKFTTWKQIEE